LTPGAQQSPYKLVKTESGWTCFRPLGTLRFVLPAENVSPYVPVERSRSIYREGILRVLIGILVSIVVAALVVVLVTPSLLNTVWSFIDGWMPAISAITINTNTNDWGQILLLPIALAAGLICGALIIDPKISNVTEAIIVVTLFIALSIVSGVNFWSNDVLISVNAQAVIDIFLTIASLATIGLMLRWKSPLLLAIAFQRVAIFIIVIFGFVIPLYYSTLLLLIRFGYAREPRETLPEWITLVSALVGFTTAFLPEIKNRISLAGKN
jgi:hypothetical protein